MLPATRNSGTGDGIGTQLLLSGDKTIENCLLWNGKESVSLVKSCFSISVDCLEMLLQPTWRTTFLASGWSARMLGIFSMISFTLALGKQKVTADCFLMFLTIESPMMSVGWGGVVGGGDLTCGDRVDLEGQAERWAGARFGAGVKRGMEQ